MNDRPERNSHTSRVAALLAAAAPVAVAFAAFAAPAQTGAAPADPPAVQPTCDIAIPSGAFGTMKWPECGGD